MIRALLALLARVLGDPRECPACGNPTGALHCDGCHNAPTYCVCDGVDLVPADCEDCGYPLDYCVCGRGYDVSDYYDYVEANR